MQRTQFHVSRAPGRATAQLRADEQSRYSLMDLLAVGGMGEVWRAFDSVLERVVVLKLVREDLAADPLAVEAFLEEARLGARLQHPGIIPIHDLGRWPDQRWYFTMREIEGSPLRTRTRDRRDLRRAIEHLRRAADAMAAAHEAAVVHRDLKPDNLLVGRHGEVVVTDWGLALLVGDSPPQLSGTPAYMSPAQARGETAATRHDVFSLGVILHEMVHRRPLWDPVDLEALRAGRLPSRTSDGDAQLAELVTRCLGDDPPDDASGVASALSDWLDGAQRTARARRYIAEADGLLTDIAQARADHDDLLSRAEELLEGIPRHATASAKRPAWALEDAAAAKGLELRQLEAERFGALQAALSLDDDLADAHARLAQHYRRRAEEAEARGEDSSEHTLLLRHHDRGEHAPWLQGQGRVSIDLHHPMSLQRAVPVDRRLQWQDHATLQGPVVDHPLPWGSWRIVVDAPDLAPLRIPLHIPRGGPVDLGTPALPASLGPDEVHVPAGWCTLGGDPHAQEVRAPRRVYIDGFSMAVHPVTHGEYLVFLNALLDAGHHDQAMAFAPRTASARGREGVPVYAQTDGRFSLAADGGDPLPADAPVLLVDWHSAMAYAAFKADRTGLPWRLPTGHEWEKAARGADGRWFSWGNDFDPSFACTLQSHPGRPLPGTVHDYPEDISPYGVRGLTGNMRDWCLNDAHLDDRDLRTERPPVVAGTGDAREIRGGSWLSAPRLVRAALRSSGSPTLRRETVGFRLARSL